MLFPKTLKDFVFPETDGVWRCLPGVNNIDYISYKTDNNIQHYNSIGPTRITFCKSFHKFKSADFYQIEYKWTKFKNGLHMRHRLDGPAIEVYHIDGTKTFTYYVDGECCAEQHFQLKVIQYLLNVNFDTARELKALLEKEI
jgi:hypothetical protein